MPEAVQGYPRWQGELSRAPRVLTIAMEELRRLMRDRWVTYALVVALLAMALSFAVTTQFERTRLDALLNAVKPIEWGALAVAAIAAGPALLDDKRLGALELYLSRAVRPWEHFAGKALAVWVATVLVVLAPSLLYYLSSIFTVENLPEGWGWVWLGLVGHSLIWGTVIAGLGLGLSAVLKSGRAATLVLFGVVFGLDVVVSELLNLIARNDAMQIISPIANLHQQNAWLFADGTAPHDFPWWWSTLVLLGLAVAGWAVAWWRRPRLRGVE